MPKLDHVIEELVTANRILAREGVVDSFGHVSVRHPDNPQRYLLSRSRAPDCIESGDIMEFTLDGSAVDPRGRMPYLERFIHGALYEARPDVMSVVHNHSESVIPFGVTGKKIKPIFHMGASIGQEVPVWDSHDHFGDTALLVENMDMGRDLAKHIGAGATALMRGHGATVAGRDIRQAVFTSVYLEVNARLQKQAMEMGEVKFLTPGEVNKVAERTGPTASIGRGRIGAGAPDGHSRRSWPEARRRDERGAATRQQLARAVMCYSRRLGLPRKHGGAEGGRQMAAVPFERIDAGAPKIAAGDPILVVDDIVKRFQTPDGVLTAIDHVSLSVAPGEFVGVIGPSGCGKSTLFNVIGGLLDGYDGTVKVAGERVRGPHRAIGMIFQEESTFPWRNVIDNVAFPLEIAGLPKAQRYERARQFVKLVGLEGFERRYPAELSGGMRQRVSMARTLAAQPKILLMDEPFAALDEQTRLLLGDKVLQIQQQLKQTTLLITHNITEAVQLSDRIVVMTYRPGKVKRVVEIALPRPRSSEIVSSEAFGRYVAQIWSDLREEASRGLDDEESRKLRETETR